MKDTIEEIRQGLIKWNIAPLGIVVFLCWCVYTLIEYYKVVGCLIEPTGVGALFVFLGGIVALLYKMYEFMQKDRGKCDHDHKDQ